MISDCGSKEEVFVTLLMHLYIHWHEYSPLLGDILAIHWYLRFTLNKYGNGFNLGHMCTVLICHLAKTSSRYWRCSLTNHRIGCSNFWRNMIRDEVCSNHSQLNHHVGFVSCTCDSLSNPMSAGKIKVDIDLSWMCWCYVFQLPA